MGIVNREGALYAATGIDNTGLYSGRQEALGIIKAMAGEITSFDVFGGIGLSAAVAFAQAAKGAYDFEKEFQKNMLEVATISTKVSGSMTDFMNQVLSITKVIPVKAPEAAKALYQIVSAGHDGAAGMKVLEVAAKAAIGGVTETATAADAITTLVNAYKMSANDAEKVSDQLFTTARLGKTTFGELGQSIAQVAPIAASYGVEMDQVLAAVATLTKSGTPTAQAMTQIRAAIIGVSKYLGDGAFNTMTFQEALDLVAKKANGSEEALRGMITEVEGVTGLLGLTGINANAAAGDLDEMNRSAGATETAFKKMAESADAQLQLLSNNITAALRPMGEAILKEVSDIAGAFNTAFSNGDIQESIKNLGALIVTVTSALVGYKGSIIATTAVKTLYVAVTNWIVKAKIAEATRLVLSGQAYAAEAAIIAKNTAAHVLLTNALKAQFVAMLKNAAAMLTNPYVLAGAAVAALGYLVYKYCTQLSAAEKAQKSFNDSQRYAKEQAVNEKKTLEEKIGILQDETSSRYNVAEAMAYIKDKYPELFNKYVDEKGHIKDLIGLLKEYNEIKEINTVVGAKTSLILAKKTLNEWESKLNKMQSTALTSNSDIEVLEQTQESVNVARERVRLAQETVDKIIAIGKEASQKAKEAEKKELEKTNAEKLKNYRSELVKAEREYNTLFAPKSHSTDKQRKIAKDKVDEWKGKIENITGKSMDQAGKEADTLREQQEKLALLMDKQALDQSRSEQDLQNQVDQARIDAMKDGSVKTLEQMQLNHKIEMQQFEREKEDKLRKAIEDARAIFDVEEDAKKAKNPKHIKGTFDASGVKLSDSDTKQYDTQKGFIGEKQKRENEEYYKSLRDSYQDYTDKRIAIEEKYNADIATLQDARKKYELEGHTEKVQQTDRAIAQATKDKGQGLMQLDYDKLKESPEYVRAFENLKQTSSETLSSLLSQLENAKHTAAQVLSPDQLREYTTTIQEIMDELDSRNPFGALADRKKELAEAEAELAKAQQQLNAVQGGAQIVTGVKNTKFNKDTGKIESEKTYLTATKAMEKYNKAQDNVAKKGAQVEKAEREVKDVMDDLFNSIKDVGDAIGGPAGEIIGLIGDIGLFTITAMNGVSTASETASKSIQAVEKASVILAIIGAAIQIAMKIASLFKDDDGVAAYEKAKDVYESYIDILDRVIEKQKELFELNSKTGEQAYEKAKETVKLQEEASRELGKQYLNSGASKGFLGIGSSASKGVDQRDDLSWKAKEDARKALGQSGYDKVMDGRMTGLFDLSAKQLADLQEKAPLFWAELHGDTRTYLEQIIACSDELNQIEEDRKEGLTKIDFESFSNGFLDTLSDMDANSEDFANSFEDYLKKAILSSLITNEYKTKIQALYDNWASYTKSGDELTKEEAEALRKEQQAISDEMLRKREELAKTFGWEMEDSSREASKKGIATASQDSVDENNGRLAVMQDHTYNINENLKEIANFGRVIMSDCSHLPRLEDIGNNLRTLTESQDIAIGHLSNIEKNTARLEAIESTMATMSRGIDTLNTKGITLKR